MAKKKIRRKNTYFNTYDDGGLLGNFASWNKGVTDKFMGSGVRGASGKLGVSSGGLGGIANGVANMANSLMNPSGNETGVGNALSAVGSLASNIPGVGGIIGAGVNLVGGLVNAAFGSNINEEFVNQTRDQAKEQGNYVSGATDNASLLSDWGSHSDMAHVSQSNVGSDGWFSNKAKNLTKELNKQIDEANFRAWTSLSNTAGNIDTQNDLNVLANFSAYGGPLGFMGGAIDYELANKDLQNKQLKALGDMRMTSMPNYGEGLPVVQTFAKGGGIHIKKKNRGKFTSYCGGKVTSACIQRGLHSSNPTTRKRANFARNARKWKHSFGGWLNTQGGDFTNGVTFIDNGGTHEQNPYDGVQMGIDQNGIPNLVEQGEVMYNDYVFSNRIKVPKSVRDKYKFTGETFADAARELQKESEERPNDPISKRGLEAGMLRLAEAQEGIRQKRGGNKFADGGDIWDPVLLDDPITVEELEGMMEEDGATTKTGKVKNSFLRYAPIIGNGLTVFSDLFSKPDYSAADRVAGVNITPAMVGYNPVGNYLSYTPLDRDFYINKLNASANATRRALQNTSGGNRATAMAGLLATDYNYGNQLGDLARQAEEYNQQLRERVEGFNRQTNLANAEMGLKASMANAASRNKATQLRLNQAGTVAAMRQAARDAYDTRRSHNLNAFLTDLGNLGREITDRNWLDFLADKGVLKVNSKGEYVVGEPKKHGGKLNRRKKKGGWRYA